MIITIPTSSVPNTLNMIIFTIMIAPSQETFNNSANPEKKHFFGGSEPSSGFDPDNQAIAVVFKSKDPPLT